MSSDSARSLRDFTRAAGGGLIVGLPLLFTMEVWFRGTSLPWWQLLLLLAVAYVVDFGYNVTSGFRRERSYGQVALDSVVTMGLGVMIAFAVLVALGRIDGDSGIRDAAGRVALEAIPIAFGASVASSQLSGEDGAGGLSANAYARLFVAAGGALLFALNVAPTDEVVLLAAGLSPLMLIVLVGLTLLLTLGLVFFADFGGGRLRCGDGLLDHPGTETLAAYAISLAMSLLLLWSFGRTDGAGVAAVAAMTVVLAVVASVGAAIARLIVGGEREGAG